MKKKLTSLVRDWDKEKSRQWLMRLTVLKMIVLMSLLTTYGRVNSQMIISNLHLEDVKLSEALEKVEALTEYDFIFSYDDVEGYQVSLDMQSATLEECLNEMLEGLPLTYNTDGDVVIVSYQKPKSKTIQIDKQEKIIIKGKVTDKNNQPLPGVSIVIKNTTFGTVTNFEGEYEFNLGSEPATLVFSFVGMLTKELKCSTSGIVNVILEENAMEVGEVVITGYTRESKVKQSSSSTKIKSEALQRQATANLDQRMEGLSTGLNINTVNAEGGEARTELILRGISTFDQTSIDKDKEIAERNFLNRQPLIVVDGFPYLGSLNDIDQNTIESIDVLKDAAATALWGLRASNGVIVITTKRGSEGKTQVRFSTNFTVGTKANLRDMEFASTADIIKIKSDWMENNERSPWNPAYNAINNTPPPMPWNPNPDPSFASKYRPLDAFDTIWAEFYDRKITESERDAKLAELAKNDVLDDFEDKFLRGGTVMENSINVSGGSKLMNYSFTATHVDEKKPIVGDSKKRLNLDLKTGFNINEKLRTIVDVSIISGEKISNGVGVSDLYTGKGIMRYDRLVDENGEPRATRQTYKPFKQEMIDKGLGSEDYNPIEDQRLNDNKDKNLGMRIAIGLNYKISNALTADVKAQYNRRNNSTRNFIDQNAFRSGHFFNRYITKVKSGPGTEAERLVPLGGRLEMNDKVSIDRIIRGDLNYNKVFDKHTVYAKVGMEATESEYTIDQKTLFDYSKKTGLYDRTFSPNRWAKDNGRIKEETHYGNAEFSSTDKYIPEIKTRTVSSFSNLRYSYDAKYNVQASLKISQGTAFGINKKLAKNYYWAVSASWNISKEDWFELDFVDYCKLRASYGLNGNMRPGLTTKTVIRIDNNNYTSRAKYASIKSISNPNLSPEKTINYNLGLDARLLKRIDFKFDVYQKVSKDLLITKSLSSTYGLGRRALLFNNGEIENQGIEIGINADILKDTKVKWSANLNLSYNKNKVVKHTDYSNINGYQLLRKINNGDAKLIGRDVSSQLKYRWGGLDENGDPMVMNKDGEKISYKSKEFDALRQKDMKATKPFNAPIFGGFSTVVRYKNWSLSAMATYKMGHVFQENLEAKYPGKEGQTSTWHKDVAKAWTKENRNTDIPALNTKPNPLDYKRRQAFLSSDLAIHDAAFVRLKDITLNYDFSKQLIRRVGLSRASLMVQVRNLGLLWTANDKNIDPESVPFSGRAITYAGNFSTAYRPGMKVPVSMVFGVKVEF